MWLVLLGLISATFAPAKPLLVEALVARVGRDAVLMSDLMRFKEIEGIMTCADLRPKVQKADSEGFQVLLNRYIEEELIYQEARNHKNAPGLRLKDAVNTIQGKKNCFRDWQDLGKRYSELWSNPNRPREGEVQLVRELEKRLMIQNFEKDQIQGDRSVWLRGARVKTPIKLFLDG